MKVKTPNVIVNKDQIVPSEDVNIQPDYMAHIGQVKAPNMAEMITMCDLETLKKITGNFGFQVFDHFDPMGQHVLHYAAMNNDPGILIYLATHGVYQDVEKVRMALLNKENVLKMDICVKNKRPEGFTPLHQAVWANNLAMVESILKMGCPIDITDNHLRTPLITAARLKKHDIVLYLLSNGADMYAEDEELDNSLHWAAYNGEPQIVNLLYNLGMDINKTDSYMQTVVHMVCNSKNVPVLKELLKKKPNLSLRDKKNRTPLDIAKERGFTSGVQLLSSQNQRMSKIDQIKNSINISTFIRYYFLFFSIYFLLHFLLTLLNGNIWLVIKNSYIFTNILIVVTFASVYYGYFCFNISNYSDSDKEAYRKLLAQPFTAESLKKFLAENHLCHMCQNVSDLKTIHCPFTDKCEKNFFDYDFITNQCITTRNILMFLKFYIFYFIFTVLGSVYLIEIGKIFIFVFSYLWITAISAIRVVFLIYGYKTKKSTAELFQMFTKPRHCEDSKCNH